MTLLMAMLSIISSMFMMLNHPLPLVILLISLTIVIMMVLFSLLNLSWLSMILLLVFLGGLLVIFTYLSALVPNEIYFFNMIWMLLILNPIFMTLMLESKPMSNQNLNIPAMVSMTETSSIFFFLIYMLVVLMVTMVMSQHMKTPLNQVTY